MKKIVSIICAALFVCAMAIPAMAENPPKAKEKAKTEQTTTTAKSTDKKSEKKCTGTCCADKEKSTTQK